MYRFPLAVLWASVCALPSAALAQDLSGTWTGATGTLTLTHSGSTLSGTAVMDGERGVFSATASRGKVKGTLTVEGDREAFVGTVSGDTLRLVFDGDDEGAEVFSRGKAAPTATASRPAAAPAPARAPTPAAPVGAATGGTYTSEGEGWSVRAPAGWKFGQKGPRVLFGSDTQPGLIVAWYAPGSTYDELQRIAAEGITDDGLVLRPTGAPQTMASPGGRAVAVDLAGTSPDGQPISARAVGVAGPQGAVGLLGITTPQQRSGLRPRVDAMARTVAFFKPKAGAGAHLLRGTLCSYSGGSVASWSRRVSFDGSGHCSSGSEMAFGGQLRDQGGNNTGSYSGYSGSSGGGTYSVSGDTVTVRLEGEATTCTVHMRQNDGRITELMCGGKLYGAGLCD